MANIWDGIMPSVQYTLYIHTCLQMHNLALMSMKLDIDGPGQNLLL